MQFKGYSSIGGFYWLRSYSSTWEDVIKFWAPAWNSFWQYRHKAINTTIFHAWPFLLILFSLFFNKNGKTLFFITLFIISIFFVLGINGPFNFLYTYIPIFSFFRCAIRFYYITTFALSYLVGTGAAELKEKLSTIFPFFDKKVLSGILFICVFLLTIGVLNPPLVFDHFMLGSMYPGFEDINQWIKNQPKEISISYYPIDFFNNRMGLYGISQHSHRNIGINVGFLSTKYWVENLKFINTGVNELSLSKLLGIFSVGYVIPLGNEEYENLSTNKEFELVYKGKNASIFRNKKLLPIIRVLSDAVGVTGENADDISLELFNTQNFNPENTVIWTAESKNEIEYLEKYKSKLRLIISSTDYSYLPYWTKVRWNENQAKFVFKENYSRMSIKGTPNSYNGFRRKINVNMGKTPFFYLLAKGSKNAKLSLKFFTKDGHMIPTGWTNLPPDWQILSLPFHADYHLEAIVIYIETIDGEEAFIDIKEIGVMDNQNRKYIIDNMESIKNNIQEINELKIAEKNTARIVSSDINLYLGKYKITMENFNDISYLVISEPWYPHWHAYVDGKKINIFRAYNAFLGIPILGKGKHEIIVKFGYSKLQSITLTITLSTIIAILIIFFITLKKINS
jgi:hypothetical protein